MSGNKWKAKVGGNYTDPKSKEDVRFEAGDAIPDAVGEELAVHGFAEQVSPGSAGSKADDGSAK